MPYDLKDFADEFDPDKRLSNFVATLREHVEARYSEMQETQESLLAIMTRIANALESNPPGNHDNRSHQMDTAALKIVKYILAQLAGRSGFDDWWDTIDDATKREIIDEMRKDVNFCLAQL